MNEPAPDEPVPEEPAHSSPSGSLDSSPTRLCDTITDPVTGTITIEHRKLIKLIGEIFVRAGCSTTEANRIAESLVGANLAGHDSHGVIRVGRYVEWLAAGIQYADKELVTLIDNGALLAVDGQYGMGQTVGPAAVNLGIERCGELGTAVVALRNAGHLGRIGEYAEMAAAAGLVSLHMVNVVGSQMVAPFGASQRRMGTNPLAFGTPVKGRSPVIHDFATSIVAEGKALVALHGGPTLPTDALVDAHGNFTDDPSVLYKLEPDKAPDVMAGAGSLRAMGEHKGSGISVMCELMAGALTGAGTAGPRPVRFCNGMLSVYVNPAVLDTDGQFHALAAQYMDWFYEANAIDPAKPVMLPGDIERQRRSARQRDGLVIPADVWQTVVGAARSVGIDDERFAQALR